MPDIAANALHSLTGTTPFPDPMSSDASGLYNPTNLPESVRTPSTNQNRVATPLRPALDAFPAEVWRKKVFGFDETHPGVLKLTKEVESFIKRCCLNRRNHHTWLVISGGTGTGKSSLAKAACDFFNIHSVDLWFEGLWSCGGKTPEAVMVDSAALATMEDKACETYLDDIGRCQLIVLDDLGSETDRFRSGTPASRLRRLLEQSQNKWLIATTNTAKADWPIVFDNRVASRLSAARIITTTGIPDYRPNLSR
jgi:DNA replication protein DnaC